MYLQYERCIGDFVWLVLLEVWPGMCHSLTFSGGCDIQCAGCAGLSFEQPCGEDWLRVWINYRCVDVLACIDTNEIQLKTKHDLGQTGLELD